MKNVLAVGEADLRIGDKTIHLTEPELFVDPKRRLMPQPVRPLLGLMRVSEFLRMCQGPVGAEGPETLDELAPEDKLIARKVRERLTATLCREDHVLDVYRPDPGHAHRGLQVHHHTGARMASSHGRDMGVRARRDRCVAGLRREHRVAADKRVALRGPPGASATRCHATKLTTPIGGC